MSYFALRVIRSRITADAQRARLPEVGLGLVLALSLVVGPGFAAPADAATRTGCHRNAPPTIRDGFPEPQRRYSRNGVLNTTLRAAVGPTTIDGKRVIAQTYDGQYPGPTLILCAGDRLKVNFKNDLPEPTNLHTHGFHVSPSGNHDNVYLDLAPGRRFQYDYRIPRDQPSGSYWYHPHRHMFVEAQIFGGLSGAIVQEGGLDRLPALRKVPQRLMIIQSTEVRDGRVLPVEDTLEKDTPLHVNGAINPTVKIRPGQIQRWRIFNANDNRIVVLRLTGQRFRVLAQDGNTLARPRAVRKLMIPPGSRREVLVRGGARGRSVMRALPFAQFPGGDKARNGGPTPNQSVITLKSAGRHSADRFPRKLTRTQEDLRRMRVDRRRAIVFDEEETASGGTDFLLNGHVFDPNRVTTMKLNSVEEWKLVNRNTEWHTFHIHVNDFQVISVNGKKRNFVDYEDNVMLPPKSTVVIRTHPTDFTGKFVFHCHVTFHEDHGMMAAVQVKRNPSAAELVADVSGDGPMTIVSTAQGSDAQPDPDATPVAWVTAGLDRNRSPVSPDSEGSPFVCRLGLSHS